MYQMKNIINHNEEITMPKCMYYVKNPNESLNIEIDNISIHISNQVMKFLKAPKTKMAELEQRQEILLKKLDILYDRIKTISSYCNSTNSSNSRDVMETIATTKHTVPKLEEVVLVATPDNLPYYLFKILKDSSISINLSWHIHSSVTNEKVAKINAFVKNLKKLENTSNVNLRLIFKSVSADSELKLSSLSVPIVGTVNILRYLSFAYPNIIPYNDADYEVDSLLDICYLLEKSPEKSKETLLKKLFLESNNWLVKNEFSIVDLAAYSSVKQSKNSVKYVPKAWFDRCEKLCS